MENISGTVSRVNGKGFMVEGRDGWLNISKYANPTPTLPKAGEVVAVTLDKSGFVRAVEPVQPVGRELAPTPATAPTIDRERAITRMATLNTATAILGSGNRAVKLDDVLTVAERLEAWVNRN